MSEIAECPVCGEVDDCEHRLVEWHGWPGERLRGSLLELVNRMEDSVERLLVECSLAGVPPRHPDIREAFLCGMSFVEAAREETASRHADPRERPRAYANVEIDREALRGELSVAATEFVADRVRAAPGVTEIVLEDPVTAHPEVEEWGSMFAADPLAVRQHLLDVLAPLEVQLDQLFCDRGETPPPAGVGD
jgi:hypothetical protein